MNASLSSSSSSAQSPNFTSAESARVVSGQRLQYYSGKAPLPAASSGQLLIPTNLTSHTSSSPNRGNGANGGANGGNGANDGSAMVEVDGVG